MLDLITLTQSARDLNYLSDVRAFCRRIEAFPERVFDPSQVDSWLDFLSPVPRYFRKHFCPEIAELAAQRVNEENYDAVLAVTLGAAPYAANLNIPFSLLDEHNVESQVLKRQCRNERSSLRRLRFAPTWMKAQQFESRIAGRFDAVTVVSESDRILMKRLLRNGHRTEVRTVPNGIDPGMLDYRGPPKENGLIIFTGALSYRANYEAAVELTQEILPLVRIKLPKARAKITGDTSGIEVSGFRVVEGVEFTGYVDDIRPVVSSASALVVPIRQGGGTRLKILEAMALGTPVVSTPIGAEGLDAIDGVHIVMGETPAELVDATSRVLADPEFAENLSRNAREFVRERYQWPAIAEEFEMIITQQRKDVRQSGPA